MFSLRLFGLSLALCTIPPTLAQQSWAVQLEAVRAHFNQSLIVPAVLPQFAPSALLSVSFKGVGNISLGQLLSREQVVLGPTLTLTSANASAVPAGRYTLMMIDAGQAGRDQSHGQWRHWLVNNVILAATTNATVSAVGGMAVTPYIAPNPHLGDGPHRYILLMWAQPADFVAPPNLNQANMGGGLFMTGDYAKVSKLGPIVAASYFTCQRGPVTASLPRTSAVVSATLPGWNGAAKPTGASGQKANSGLSATRNALALFLAPIMGLLAL